MSQKVRIEEVGFDYAAKVKRCVGACNLCGITDWTMIAHHDRYGYPAQTTACSRCGLVMLNPRMTDAEYREFYAHWYRPLVSAYHGRTIDAATIQSEQRLYSEEIEQLVAPYLVDRRNQSFLDIGGSTGVVARHFNRCFGVLPTVLDPAPNEIEEAEKIGLKTITGLVETWDPGGSIFDIVGMFQTIDHLLDIRGTLEKIRKIIHPEGLLVVDIVDFRAAYLKNWSVERAIKIDHPYGLTESTMESYLAQTGFRPIRKAYSADHHLVAYVCHPVDPRIDDLPDPMDVKLLFREMRYVQNVVRPAGEAA